MRRAHAAFVLAGFLFLPSTQSAEVVVRPYDSSAAGVSAEVEASEPVLRANAPASELYVPYFEVDTRSPYGTTTNFAVRNTSTNSLGIDVYYYLVNSKFYFEHESHTLAPYASFSRNIRDLDLPSAGGDGILRGRVFVEQSSSPAAGVLVGEYLQVDVDDNFATGERMVSPADFCTQTEVRFIDLGQPTQLRILLRHPAGANPDQDPPSIVVSAVDGSGTVYAPSAVYTNRSQVVLTSLELTSLSFGTLRFNFSESDGGIVHAVSSAEGRYSVGLNGACTVP